MVWAAVQPALANCPLAQGDFIVVLPFIDQSLSPTHTQRVSVYSDGSSDLEKAIALSLKESQPKSTSSVASSSLYPQMAMTPATSNGPSNHIGGTVTTAPSSGEKQVSCQTFCVVDCLSHDCANAGLLVLG